MYLAINKDTLKAELHTTKGTLATFLGVDVRTISKYIQSGEPIKKIYILSDVEPVKNRGKKRAKSF
jgi:hypothetical protein